jgi:hypothetical protein
MFTVVLLMSHTQKGREKMWPTNIHDLTRQHRKLCLSIRLFAHSFVCNIVRYFQSLGEDQGSSPKKLEVYHQHNHERHKHQWSIRFPPCPSVGGLSSGFKTFTLCQQRRRHALHMLQLLTALQHILNVGAHDMLNFRQTFVEPLHIFRGPGIEELFTQAVELGI